MYRNNKLQSSKFINAFDFPQNVVLLCNYIMETFPCENDLSKKS